jgi:hypothetical protein
MKVPVVRDPRPTPPPFRKNVLAPPGAFSWRRDYKARIVLDTLSRRSAVFESLSDKRALSAIARAYNVEANILIRMK